MAIIKCPECGKEFSDKAAACPNCGCPVEEAKVKKHPLVDSAGSSAPSASYNERPPISTTPRAPAKKSGLGKKIVIGIALVIALFAIIGSFGGDGKDSSGSSTTAQQKSLVPPQSEEYTQAMELPETDSQKVNKLFEQGVEKGCPWCMNGLGCSYVDGYGVKQDIKKGLELIKKAADLNVPVALSNMGYFYENGKFGIPVKHDTALEYYKKARDLGMEGLDNTIYNLENLPDFFLEPYPLMKAYEKNEVAADQKYKGKTIRLTGRVNDVGKDIMDNIYITFIMPSEWEIRNVQCFFDNKHSSDLADLEKGDEVVVQGRVDGLMMNVILKDCWIVKK